MGWVSNDEYVFIDESGRELSTVHFFVNQELKTDGGGLYVYLQDAKHCVVMDYQGVKLSTIEREYDISEFGFINGLIRIENFPGQPNKDGNPEPPDTTYYLPNGTPVFYAKS